MGHERRAFGKQCRGNGTVPRHRHGLRVLRRIDELPKGLSHITPAYKRALWIAIVLNVGYGLVEMAGGFISGSQALKADALDFLGDGLITFLGILAIGNAAVVVAAGLVAWTGTAWPDLGVAAVIAGLFLQSSWMIVRDDRAGRAR